MRIEELPVVKEFVFLEELLGLASNQAISFEIYLLLGTSSISKAPYHIVPIELKELLDKGFICPTH